LEKGKSQRKKNPKKKTVKLGQKKTFKKAWDEKTGKFGASRGKGQENIELWLEPAKGQKWEKGGGRPAPKTREDARGRSKTPTKEKGKIKEKKCGNSGAKTRSRAGKGQWGKQKSGGWRGTWDFGKTGTKVK